MASASSTGRPWASPLAIVAPKASPLPWMLAVSIHGERISST